MQTARPQLLYEARKDASILQLGDGQEHTPDATHGYICSKKQGEIHPVQTPKTSEKCQQP